MPDEPTSGPLRSRLRHKLPIHPTLSLFVAVVATVVTAVVVVLVMHFLSTGGSFTDEPGGRSRRYLMLTVIVPPAAAIYFWVSAFRDREAWKIRTEVEADDPNSPTRRPWYSG